MNTQSLPIVDESRQEFGYKRTICDCQFCVSNCRHMPGFLIPSDIRHIKEHVSPDTSTEEFATKYLAASPGAKVARETPEGMLVFRIPTLVPARDPQTNHCIFLKDDRCTIHRVSPYGCSFFDCKDTAGAANSLSMTGLQAIAKNISEQGEYVQLWNALDASGLKAPGPEACRDARASTDHTLAFSPEDVATMRARYAKAVAETAIVTEYTAVSALLSCTRKHVFDFDNGMRLIVGRASLISEAGLSNAVICLSVSAMPDTYLRTKLHGRSHLAACTTLVSGATYAFKQLSEHTGKLSVVNVTRYEACLVAE